jgi:hypothetical protein
MLSAHNTLERTRGVMEAPVRDRGGPSAHKRDLQAVQAFRSFNERTSLGRTETAVAATVPTDASPSRSSTATAAPLSATLTASTRCSHVLASHTRKSLSVTRL